MNQKKALCNKKGFFAQSEKYEALKPDLWKKIEYDRDAYTNAKTDFK